MPRGASAKRHAQAVFQIALERDQLDKWQEDLDAIAAVFREPRIRLVLESPKVRLDRKLGLIRRLLSKVDRLAMNLASLLIARGRVRIAEGIAEEYRRLLNAHRGLEAVEVTTAVPLGKRDQERISDRLATSTGKQIMLSASVSPEIIGGLILRVGDKLIDGSTRSRLAEMRRMLVERRV